MEGSDSKTGKFGKTAAESGKARVSKSRKHVGADPGRPRKRAARGTREQRIVAGAIDFFAEEGFRASTRDLARRLGVTQALLYRYFKSKQELIDRVFAEVFVEQWDDDDTKRLLDATKPLAARLTVFYQSFARRFSVQRARLFMRAELDDQKLAERYTLPLNDRVLTPVVTALRQEAGLPTIDTRPVLRAERELAMALHGAIAHLGLRKYIYGSPLPDDLGDHVAFYVACFLEGAIPSIKRLHESRPQGMLGERLASGEDTQIE